MSEKDNAFRRIFDAASQEPETATQREKLPQTSHELESPASKPRGRPRGKKSDPDFVSAIAYIRKKTHLQVKRLLLDKEEQGEKQDFSELVQELLEFWVEIQQEEDSSVSISRFSHSQKFVKTQE